MPRISGCVVAGVRLAVLACVNLVNPTDVGAGQLTASWVDNSGGAAITRLERRASAGSTFTPIADVPPGTSSYVDSDVSSGQGYCYRALAYDSSSASPYSAEACATVAAAAPTTSLSVTVGKAGTGSGLVTSTPGGISCSPVCEVTFAGGTTVSLAATPAAGSTFSGWTGGGCAGTSTCTLSGSVPVTVTATFTLATPTVTTPPPPSGDTTAPVVTLALTSGTMLRKSVLRLNATAQDNVGIAKVDFYLVNDSKLLCSTAASPYACDWVIPAARNKTWVLQATATDAAGNVGLSQRITVSPQ